MFLKRIKIGIYILIAAFLILGFRLWQLQIMEGERYKRLSEDNRLRIIKTHAPRGIIYDRNGVPLVKNVPFFSASITTNDLKTLDRNAIAELLGLNSEDIKTKIEDNNSPFVPIRLKQGLTFEDVARIEARRSDFPGLFVEIGFKRKYPFGKIGGHVIGHLGKITQLQKNNNPQLRDIPPDTLIGQWGAEALFDDILRGSPGEKVIKVDAFGRELRLLQERQPVKGQDVQISIDINIQKAIEGAFGNKAGALVAIKPDSGEILALESLPSFDPNLFSMGVSYYDWKSLTENKKKPLLNRSVQSQYPPASTFKLITAIAALEEGIIDPAEKITCTGRISHGNWTFGCWRREGHGHVYLHRAFVESCSVYFYEVGRRLGIDRIYKHATALGLGRETGIEIIPARERQGLMPNADWKMKNTGIPWYLGDTLISAIGQGYVTATPIQMAVAMAAVVNGGYIYRPTLTINDKKLINTVRLKPETVEIMKKALSGVVNEPNGTAQRARSEITVIGGKTGTAQAASRRGDLTTDERFMTHAWFVAVAPVDNPEIVLSVFVEHGGRGGTVAAPIARKAIDAYMKSKEQRVQGVKDSSETHMPTSRHKRE
jgi:penicillin-binding protein 2